MSLPYLNFQPNKSLKTIGSFGGLNERAVADENEFADMKNVSDRFYPTIATRKPRGVVQETLAAPHGLIWKNGLFYVEGLSAYYNGELIQGLTLTDGDKQLVGMGAYVVIFPDKVAFNTSTKTFSTLESTLNQSASATFAPLSTDSAFTKITMTGIHNYFKVYDAVTISGCTNADYNATKIITELGTDYIVVTGALSASFTQASGLTFKRSVPDFDYVCEYNNRLWGCSSANHEIYASKLGDPFNWNCFEGISTDSYVMTVGSDGDFTGCIAHMGYVIFFKEQYIHVMYGDKPSNYSLNTKQLPGVREGCHRTLQIINETLYYVGRNGVYAYNGAVPTSISDKLTKEFTTEISAASAVVGEAVSGQAVVGESTTSVEFVAGKQDDIYYLSCYRDGKPELLTYDTKYQLWHHQDDLRFKFTAYGEGILYYIDADNQLSTITGDRDELIEWYLESGDITEGLIDQKYISKIRFNFEMEHRSEANIFIKYDDEPLWERKGTIKSINNQTFVFPIIPKRCNKFRYRIEGFGQFKLFGLAREVEGGSEVNGSVYTGFRR